MSDKKLAQREFGADLIRITAVLMLLVLHFFLRNGFYYKEIQDGWGFLAVMVRSIVYCCVPLFMVLTGYLKCGRTWTASHYRSIIPILISYGIISLIHLVYKITFLKVSMPPGEWILQFFSFKLANYSWYVGMYIGLFLLSPILNLAWNACSKRWQYGGIVLTMAAITSLPATVNKITAPDYSILPAYFTQIYYVTYYYIGCYIKTCRPRVRRSFCLLGLAAVSAVTAAINILTRTEPARFSKGYSPGYGDIPIMIMTSLIFLALYECRTRRPGFKRAAAFLSGMVLEIYLLSWLFDTNIYPKFQTSYPMSYYIPFGFLMVSSVFILALLAAFPVNRISKMLYSKLYQ
ncbi:MAG: acyltransferase [Lachnospiraceae bacterium]